MFIVIHCGGMPFSGKSFDTLSLGGSESSAYYLAKAFVKKGHQITVFTNEKTECKEEGVKYVWTGNVSNRFPLGDRFDTYATNTPTDVLIIQRHQKAFINKYQSNLNLWWLHDLVLHRSKSLALAQMYNIDGILTVSEYHKEQVHDVYGVEKDFIHVINNGVDLDMYNDVVVDDGDTSKFNMIYSSRPERGLENLVMPDGIMEKLWKKDKSINLDVCMYDNHPQHLKQLYEQLNDRCRELPNVTLLGSLTKRELAGVQKSSDLCCYPTEFEEVSCITAMEAMAAKTPFLSSDVAALYETCKRNVSSGSILLRLQKDGLTSINNFVKRILILRRDKNRLGQLTGMQIDSAPFYSYDRSVNSLLNICEDLYIKKMSNKGSVARHLMRTSDIQRLKKYLKESVTEEDINNSLILQNTITELEECYTFSNSDTEYNDHYQRYYRYEKEIKGVNFGPEDLSNKHRYRGVLNFINNVNSKTNILDFGCAHGHYTYNFAKDLPEAHITGVDVSSINIGEAVKLTTDYHAKSGYPGLSNLEFYKCETVNEGIKFYKPEPDGEEITLGKFDYIILGEILEHLMDPEKYLNHLSRHSLVEGGIIIITTPYGPWEHMGYEKEHPWRAHLWHFDKSEIYTMFGHLPNFEVKCVPHVADHTFEMMGSFIYKFSPGNEEFKSSLEYVPFKEIAPKETISLCMIVRDAENTIRETLCRMIDHVDEIIICVDEETKDSTLAIIRSLESTRRLWPIFTVFTIESPLKIGFDAARNKSIEKACGDWILWVDSDEKMFRVNYMHLHTRHSPVKGYMVAQHHFSIHPLGVLKTDFPVRLFRNFEGTKFFGRVHEHPEKELNKGVGLALPAANFCLSHDSYEDEEVRRRRFHRNISLLVRDREELPDRRLGKFLWIRDLAQMSTFELEQGSNLTTDMIERAKKGIKLWEELLNDKALRMCIDSLPYYSTFSKMLGEGFNYSSKFDTSLAEDLNYEKGIEITGTFHSKKHLNKLLTQLLDEKVKDYGSKYY